MMKPIVPVTLGVAFFVMALMTTISSARMNETESQMQSRYGEPEKIPDNPFTQMLSGALTRVYHYQGWTIKASFLNGKVARIHYAKQGKANVSPSIQDDEAKAVLDAETGDGKWEEISKIQSKPLKSLPWACSNKAWVHSNGNVACLCLNRLYIQIDSPIVDVYLARLAAEKEAKRKASIPKF